MAAIDPLLKKTEATKNDDSKAENEDSIVELWNKFKADLGAYFNMTQKINQLHIKDDDNAKLEQAWDKVKRNKILCLMGQSASKLNADMPADIDFLQESEGRMILWQPNPWGHSENKKEKEKEKVNESLPSEGLADLGLDERAFKKLVEMRKKEFEQITEGLKKTPIYKINF